MALTQTTDSPTSNFATMTPIDGSPAVFSDGNLKITSDTTNAYRGGTSTIGLPSGSGKWYCEALCTGSTGSNAEYVFGAAVNTTDKAGGYFPGTSGQTAKGANDEHGYYSGSGGIVYNGSSSTGSVGEYDGGDRVALRFDMDASSPTCKFYVNNTLKHTANLTAGVTYFPHFNVQDSGLSFTVNFGASDFTYTLPTDHLAISAANMFTATSPTIEDGSAYMQTTIYTGNGGSLSVTQDGTAGDNVAKNSTFKPDWLWTKKRASGTGGHALFDVVRTDSNGQFLRTDNTLAEDDEPGFASFDVKGFSWDGAGTEVNINANTSTYVAWQWLADNTVGGSSNGDGSITTTISVNQTSGFSILTWQGDGNDGATIGHGLGKTPAMIIYRKRAAQQWFCQHVGCTGGIAAGGSTKQLVFDTTPAAEGGPFSGGYIDTVGTSTVTLQEGSSSMVNCNDSGADYIGYFFAEIPGYSAFGKFFGNGSADGPFIECGLSPSYVMTKKINTGTGGEWYTVDSARDTYNPADLELTWNRNNAEDGDQGSDHLDFLSNGFKMRSSGGGSANDTGCTTIYMAFASNPFAGTTPTTAR